MDINYINKKTLKDWIDKKKKIFLIDVLPPEYYNEKHIKGAVNAPVYEVIFLDYISKLSIKKNDICVLYGSSKKSMDSTIAAEKLINKKFKNVYVFKEGIKEWEKSNFEIVYNEKNKISLPDIKNKKYKIIREKSLVEWAGRNFNYKHIGTIDINKGSLRFENNLLVEGSFEINMKSIKNLDIKDEKTREILENHLKSDDFFDVKNFPKTILTFRKIKNLFEGDYNERHYRIIADLTIKGITNKVEFEAVIGPNTDGIFFQTQFSIDRTLWNVNYGSSKFFEKLGMHLVSSWIYFDIHIFLK